jgi:hypothetical protein
MNAIARTLLSTAALCVLSFSAVAAPECTQEPKEKWMSESDMKARIVIEGYTIKRFLISGSCYEIYGKDKQGKNVEIYFNPVNGKIVKQRAG